MTLKPFFEVRKNVDVCHFRICFMKTCFFVKLCAYAADMIRQKKNSKRVSFNMEKPSLVKYSPKPKSQSDLRRYS